METTTRQLVAQFRALAEPVRLRLLALTAQGECSVSELTEVLGLSQPRVSQHLKTLVEASLVERFRDGHFVYYRVPRRGTAVRRRLLELLPADEPELRRDAERLRRLRSGIARDAGGSDDRALHHALVELTVARPLGDLLDIGCGQGRILKLLASRAQRAVGVDIDANARRFARAELLLAGLPNCTLRQGDMYQLPFADAEFDTVILDDVLGDAADPAAAVAEAARLLKPAGRLWLLSQAAADAGNDSGAGLAAWCRSARLRLASPKPIPAHRARWLLAVATHTEPAAVAA